MLLPTLSVKDVEIELMNKKRIQQSENYYVTFKERAEKANQKLVHNQARVQLNRQQIKNQAVDYLTP
jgi:hypothetical protein